MANCNVPFVLLQQNQCVFKPSISSSKLIHYTKSDVVSQVTKAKPEESKDGKAAKNGAYFDKPGGEDLIFQPRNTGVNEDSEEQTSIFEETQKNLLVLCDETSGSIAICHQELHLSKGNIKPIKSRIGMRRETCELNDFDIDELDNRPQVVSKFLMRVQPKVLLVPSISDENTGTVLSHILVRSPAPQITASSAMWLLTLHEDNLLRLWNTDDGRCIIVSHPGMLVTKVKSIVDIKGFPGVVGLVGVAGDVYIVNTYTMQMLNHLSIEFQGVHKITFREADNSFVLCDESGKIVVCKDANHINNNRKKMSDQRDSKGRLVAFNQRRVLQYLRNDTPFSFKFEQIVELGAREEFEVRRLKNNDRVLTYSYVDSKNALIICQDQIEQILNNERLVLKEFTTETYLIYAKFIKVKPSTFDQRNQPSLKRNTDGSKMRQTDGAKHSEYLICIDVNCRVIVYDKKVLLQALTPSDAQVRVMRVELVKPLYVLDDLFSGSQIFDFQRLVLKDISTSQDVFHSLLSDYSSKEEEVAGKLKELKQLFIDQYVKSDAKAIFQYAKQPDQNLLYTTLQLKSTNVFQEDKDTSIMLSWHLETILKRAVESLQRSVRESFDLDDEEAVKADAKSLEIDDIGVPLCITNLGLFNQEDTTSQWNCLINFNKLIMKTYYNRLQYQFFFTDEKVTKQVTFADQHSPSLIIGTNYGRIFVVPMFQELEYKVFPVVLIDSHHQSPITNLFLAYQGARNLTLADKGGHLFSTSEDGTICVTDLSSQHIKTLQVQFKVNSKEKKRADNMLQSKLRNQRAQRRHSITSIATTQNYFQFVRVKADHVFDEICPFSQINHIFKIKSLEDITAYAPKQPKEQQVHVHSRHNNIHYGFLTESADFVLLVVSPHRNSPIQVQAHKLSLNDMSSKAIGIYEDMHNKVLHILNNSLNLYTFNLRSLTMSCRQRNYLDTFKMLEVDTLVNNLLLSNNPWMKQMQKTHLNVMNYESFNIDKLKDGILRGLGSHQVLDFLSLSINMPLQYQPEHRMGQKYTKRLMSIMNVRDDLLKCFKEEESAKNVLLTVNQLFVYEQDQRLQSDFNHILYKETAGVTNMQTQGNNFCNSNQQIILANIDDMLPVLQEKMKSFKKSGTRGTSAAMQDAMGRKTVKVGQGLQKASTLKGDDDRGTHLLRMQTELGMGGPRDNLDPNVVHGQYFHSHKWPAKLLGLVHPFNLDDQLDENLEHFFNLNLPFLDFRIGVQGAEQAFSFVISKEDQDYHQDRENLTKVMSLLKLSKQIKCKITDRKLPKNVRNVLQKLVDPADCTLYLGRFFNSEYWKVSPYMSSMIPVFFLSMLVSIVELDEHDIKILAQEWLYVLQHITMATHFKQSPASPLDSPRDLSLSVISQLLLKYDHNISSCTKDIILKPMLCNQSPQSLRVLRVEINNWQELVIDTYEELKSETLSRQHHPPNESSGTFKAPYADEGADESVFARSMTVQGDYANRNIYPTPTNAAHGGGPSGTDRQTINFDEQMIQSQSSAHQSQRPLSHYFGELEIRGLINLSMYAFYCQNDKSMHLDQQVQDRVAKLVVILIREVVAHFKDNRDYIHLLTILLNLLQTGLKTANANFKRKAIMEDVIRLLLYIFNFYKPPLNREQFITRVAAENFNMIRPTNSELYLKLMAAKALLEIGVSFTDEFLVLIQKHATILDNGAEHQQNVLETLRYFINGYGENLERYLIQLVQILLRCLDPNDLALRKNSYKHIGVILTTMVKMFPMVAFHPASQRLAVGTHDGPIGIYDVRTSAKWKILEGHTGNVTCLVFDSKGTYLATYSAVDLTLKLWKVGSTGFFSTIMGGTGKHTKQVKLKSLGSRVRNPHVRAKTSNPSEMDQRGVSFLPERGETTAGGKALSDEPAASPSQIEVKQLSSGGGGGQRINKCKIRFMMPAEKQVELIREDGSREIHSLVR